MNNGQAFILRVDLRVGSAAPTQTQGVALGCPTAAFRAAIAAGFRTEGAEQVSPGQLAATPAVVSVFTITVTPAAETREGMTKTTSSNPKNTAAMRAPHRSGDTHMNWRTVIASPLPYSRTYLLLSLGQAFCRTEGNRSSSVYV